MIQVDGRLRVRGDLEIPFAAAQHFDATFALALRSVTHPMLTRAPYLLYLHAVSFQQSRRPEVAQNEKFKAPKHSPLAGLLPPRSLRSPLIITNYTIDVNADTLCPWLGQHRLRVTRVHVRGIGGKQRHRRQLGEKLPDQRSDVDGDGRRTGFEMPAR
ncbi:hypothetical protein MYCTH_2305708 [Thermothelomyces thermophilus ATCC 42464]|uniref:Uncharacterized protein n=1 Tax=Thermothelomyces thermophilus (strain ATCC 42464 / BCRC 31852 / DSM 1799) TaxID=573729 RepID=G2QDZ1_THET4|nr:uncharacterized protein MYCTH_2305708 [Thermothelomyces thermophilus ATCC 42464]AEO58400.1 hypothetical protein MYCTH_2305708 [Thermothelomyces thermophilus ATCC 42464]